MNLLREGEEGDDLAPRPAPTLVDSEITLAPFTCFEGGLAFPHSLGIERAVNPLQDTCRRLAMLPGDEVDRVPEKVDDASLDDRFWEHSGDCIPEALEPINDGQYDTFHAAVLELVHDEQPELGAFVLFDP